MKLKYIFFGLISLMFVSACNQPKIFTEADIQIIPKPKKLELYEGFFEFTKETKFVVPNASLNEVSDLLRSKFDKAAGWLPAIVDVAPKENYIIFKTDTNFKKEAYSIAINSNRVLISASANAGFLYGLETIRQLLPVAIESEALVADATWVIPNAQISDEPRFRYRGLMLDVSRHFFGKTYIKKTIDRLAMHKMNVLHLHLVDDQGWRIEIKQYPKLTEKGAYRVDQEDLAWNSRKTNSPDAKGSFGGYLTQEELKEIVAYAQTKNVEVIPEIEMPAHVSSAIASYPKLSCFNKPIAVPSGGLWPITDIYCAGKESTFEFLENVLEEVMEIFPSKYIHIGGDEATKTNWQTCPRCQKRIKDENLKDVEELQSYFVKRMEKFINAKGKKLIGWDEILEGGLAPEATVMSWRGTLGGFKAAEQGHDVIMTPESHCYFNFYQGPQNEEPKAFNAFTPLNKVYEFDPVVEGMNEEQANHVLGGQANLWSEFITTDKSSEYMIFPRLAALSETLWSSKDSRNWKDFTARLESQMNRYDYLGINYAKSAYLITASSRADLENKSVKIALKNEFYKPDIRYVLGDEILDKTANKYSDSITIKETTIIKAALFKEEKPIGKFFIDTVVFHKAFGKKISFKHPYSDSYQGDGSLSALNTIRGSKNFHDGQWQAWIDDNMEAVIDLERVQTIRQISVGTLENQGAGIYFPTAISIFASEDGKIYNTIGRKTRVFATNSNADLFDFEFNFESIQARYVKVIATKLEQAPNGGGVWLFVDEILVN